MANQEEEEVAMAVENKGIAVEVVKEETTTVPLIVNVHLLLPAVMLTKVQ